MKKQKRPIELNGVLNAQILLDRISLELPPRSKIASRMKEQLMLLERYMVAYNRAIVNDKIAPNWDDIAKNPNKYLP